MSAGPTPEFEAMLAAALGVVLTAAGEPGVAAVVVPLAPKVLDLFFSMATRHAAGEPLPDVLKAPRPDDEAALDRADEGT